MRQLLSSSESASDPPLSQPTTATSEDQNSSGNSGACAPASSQTISKDEIFGVMEELGQVSL